MLEIPYNMASSRKKGRRFDSKYRSEIEN